MARGLTAPCRGRPAGGNTGGRAAQLKLLRASLHPLSREPLPPAVDEEGRCLLVDRSVKVDAERLAARKGGRMKVANVEYPSASSSIYTGTSTAAGKMRAMLERVRSRQREAASEARKLQLPRRQLRRLRGKQRPNREWVEQIHEDAKCSVCHLTVA